MDSAMPDLQLPSQPHGITASGNKLYSLVTEAHVCEQLAQGSHLKVQWPGAERMMGPDLQNILRLSYDNAKVTINLRRTSNLQNILQ